MIEILQPSFKPDLSKAVRIVGKASAMPFKGAFSNDQLPLTIRILEELTEGESSSPEMATALDANHKSVASTFCSLKKSGFVDFKWFRKPKRQRMAMYSISEKGRKHLEGFNREKPLPPVAGVSSNRLLESVDVESKEKVFSSPQSLNQ